MKVVLRYRDVLYLLLITFMCFFAFNKRDNRTDSNIRYVVRESRQKYDSLSDIISDFKEKVRSDSLLYAKLLTEINKAKIEKSIIAAKITKLYEKLRENDATPNASDSTLYEFFAGFNAKN